MNIELEQAGPDAFPPLTTPRIPRSRVELQKLTAVQMVALINLWASMQPDRGAYRVPNVSEASKLWSVLTALRGPDTDDGTLKLETTQIIRGATVPALASCAGALWTRRGSYQIKKSVVDTADYSHFMSHVRTAAGALGIPIR